MRILLIFTLCIFSLFTHLIIQYIDLILIIDLIICATIQLSILYYPMTKDWIEIKQFNLFFLAPNTDVIKGILFHTMQRHNRNG
jgi:hypothetical protein